MKVILKFKNTKIYNIVYVYNVYQKGIYFYITLENRYIVWAEKFKLRFGYIYGNCLEDIQGSMSWNFAECQYANTLD